MTLIIGSELGVVEATYQPMKIAAAEAQWTTCSHCSFSLFQIGGGNNDHTPIEIIQVPGLLSFLATNSFSGTVKGLNELQAQDVAKYGPGYYVPNVFIQYWSMRIMAYTASLVALLALWGVWLLYRRRLDGAKWFLRVSILAIFSPILMNTAGWMLTESGRQPWIVQNLMKTSNGLTPLLNSAWVWISLVAFVAIYIAMGIVMGMLMFRYGKKSLDESEAQEPEPVVGGELRIGLLRGIKWVSIHYGSY